MARERDREREEDIKRRGLGYVEANGRWTDKTQFILTISSIKNFAYYVLMYDECSSRWEGRGELAYGGKSFSSNSGLKRISLWAFIILFLKSICEKQCSRGYV